MPARLREYIQRTADSGLRAAASCWLTLAHNSGHALGVFCSKAHEVPPSCCCFVCLPSHPPTRFGSIRAALFLCLAPPPSSKPPPAVPGSYPSSVSASPSASVRFVWFVWRPSRTDKKQAAVPALRDQASQPVSRPITSCNSQRNLTRSALSGRAPAATATLPRQPSLGNRECSVLPCCAGNTPPRARSLPSCRIAAGLHSTFPPLHRSCGRGLPH